MRLKAEMKKVLSNACTLFLSRLRNGLRRPRPVVVQGFRRNAPRATSPCWHTGSNEEWRFNSSHHAPHSEMLPGLLVDEPQNWCLEPWSRIGQIELRHRHDRHIETRPHASRVLKLWKNSPAAMSATIASATSAVTSGPRRRCDFVPAPPARPP